MINLIKDKNLRVVLISSVVLYGAVIISTLATFASRREAIVLHFDVYRGIDFVGGRLDLFGALIGGLVMGGINFLLVNFLYSRDRFFAFILAYATLFLTLLLAGAMAIVASMG